MGRDVVIPDVPNESTLCLSKISQKFFAGVWVGSSTPPPSVGYNASLALWKAVRELGFRTSPLEPSVGSNFHPCRSKGVRIHSPPVLSFTIQHSQRDVYPNNALESYPTMLLLVPKTNTPVSLTPPLHVPSRLGDCRSFLYVYFGLRWAQGFSAVLGRYCREAVQGKNNG